MEHRRNLLAENVLQFSQAVSRLTQGIRNVLVLIILKFNIEKQFCKCRPYRHSSRNFMFVKGCHYRRNAGCG